MVANNVRRVLSLIRLVSISIHIVMWPVAVACLVLPKSYENLKLLVEAFVVANGFLIGVKVLISAFWNDEDRHLRRERRPFNPAGFHFWEIEKTLYGIVVMLVAFRLATLKFYWAIFVVLGIFGLAAMLYWYREYRIHPERYAVADSAPARTTPHWVRFAGTLIGIIHVSIWFYAWKDWFR